MDLSTVQTPRFLDERTKVILELFHSETIYVTNLRNVIEGIMNPLLLNGIIPKKTTKEIFSNIAVILKFHEELLLPDLTKCIQNWSEDTIISALFLSLSPCFKLYIEYCSNYEKSVGLVQSHKKSNPAFSKFLTEAQQSERFNNSYITSYLILPVQRIPRYEMFLKQLIKHTDPNHHDYVKLQLSLKAVVDTTVKLDGACKRAENILKIIEISKAISMENLLTPVRQFIREDDTNELKLELSASTCTPTKIYLFNDLIVFSIEKKSKIYVNSSFILHMCWIEDYCSSDSIQFITPNFISVFQFDSEDTKVQWVNEYNNLLSSLKKNIHNDNERNSYYLEKLSNGQFILHKRLDPAALVASITNSTTKKKSKTGTWKVKLETLTGFKKKSRALKESTFQPPGAPPALSGGSEEKEIPIIPENLSVPMSPTSRIRRMSLPHGQNPIDEIPTLPTYRPSVRSAASCSGAIITKGDLKRSISSTCNTPNADKIKQ